jgi:RimJ/RimL family protein N-acetyltransferase
MAAFAFGQLGCQAVVARIDGDNFGLRRSLMRRGFTAHDVPRLRGRDKAETIMILTEENARSLRVLEVRHGRKAA